MNVIHNVDSVSHTNTYNIMLTLYNCYKKKYGEKITALTDLTRSALTLPKLIILKKMKILRKVDRKWEEIRRRQRKVVAGA